jgi:uncharacterized protein (DUF2062 family)
MTDDPINPPATTPDVPKRTFWQRRLRDPIVAQLTQGVTPDKIALTIAVGSALALFPILGTTTILCLLVGIILRLNQPIIQVVNWLCTPIHIPLIFYTVHLGEKLFGAPHTKLKLHELAQLVWQDPVLFAQKFGMTGVHACIVWVIAAPFWIVLIYFTARTTLREMARVRVLAAAKLAAPKVIDPNDHPIP